MHLVRLQLAGWASVGGGREGRPSFADGVGFGVPTGAGAGGGWSAVQEGAAEKHDGEGDAEDGEGVAGGEKEVSSAMGGK